MGDGQVFKGKLIGVLEVPEARGDRMCQNAIQELKMAVRASGEHKQRVVIHIAVDGLKIRDEKTGVSDFYRTWYQRHSSHMIKISKPLPHMPYLQYLDYRVSNLLSCGPKLG